MFGEAVSIDTLRVELVRVLRESTNLLSSTIAKSSTDLLRAINDSAGSRDEHTRLLIEACRELNLTLKRFIRPPTPRRLQLVVTGEGQMANILNFKINLPELPPEPNDIVSGELTLVIGEAAPQIIFTAKDQVEVLGFAGKQDDTVEAAYVFIDDAGNRSEQPSTLTVVLTDTIAPAVPGALGIVVTGETVVVDEPVEDPPADEPGPEIVP